MLSSKGWIAVQFCRHGAQIFPNAFDEKGREIAFAQRSALSWVPWLQQSPSQSHDSAEGVLINAVRDPKEIAPLQRAFRQEPLIPRLERHASKWGNAITPAGLDPDPDFKFLTTPDQSHGTDTKRPQGRQRGQLAPTSKIGIPWAWRLPIAWRGLPRNPI